MGHKERRASEDFTDIVMESRTDAEAVLDILRKIISRQGSVTVGSLYDIVGILTGNYTDELWGWRDLKTATVRPVQGGFTLGLPPALQL